MPRHWKEPTETPWFGAKEWAVGQGMQLRDSLQRLARRARGSTWPEYAELDCIACHHSLTAPKDSWRQEAGYPDARRASPLGTPRASSCSATRPPQPMRRRRKLESEIATLSSLMGQLSGDREQIAASADRAASAGRLLTRELNNRTYDQAFTCRSCAALPPIRASHCRGSAPPSRPPCLWIRYTTFASRAARRTTMCKARSRALRPGAEPVGL